MCVSYLDNISDKQNYGLFIPGLWWMACSPFSKYLRTSAGRTSDDSTVHVERSAHAHLQRNMESSSQHIVGEGASLPHSLHARTSE